MLTTLIYIVHIFVLLLSDHCRSAWRAARVATIAAAFGGQGSQTAFTARAARPAILTKATTWCAIIFMLTSITLSIAARRTRLDSKSVLTDYKSTPAAPAKPENSPAPKK